MCVLRDICCIKRDAKISAEQNFVSEIQEPVYHAGRSINKLQNGIIVLIFKM